MGTQPAPHKETDEEALRAANTRFYAAFESLNIDEMDAVWERDDGAQCVHPGWELLLGWEEIRESWQRIFANSKRVRIALSSVWTRIEGDVGWVACTEHITTAFADGFDEASAQATNIFLRRDGRWLLVGHHASPLADTSEPTVQ